MLIFFIIAIVYLAYIVIAGWALIIGLAGLFLLALLYCVIRFVIPMLGGLLGDWGTAIQDTSFGEIMNMNAGKLARILLLYPFLIVCAIGYRASEPPSITGFIVTGIILICLFVVAGYDYKRDTDEEEPVKSKPNVSIKKKQEWVRCYECSKFTFDLSLPTCSNCGAALQLPETTEPTEAKGNLSGDVDEEESWFIVIVKYILAGIATTAVSILSLVIVFGGIYFVMKPGHDRRDAMERQVQEQQRLAATQRAQQQTASRSTTSSVPTGQRVYTRGGRYLIASTEDALVAAMDNREAAARLIAAGQVMREDLRADVEVQIIGEGSGWSARRAARVRLQDGNVVWIDARGLVWR